MLIIVIGFTNKGGIMDKVKCVKCGYEWLKRQENPKCCPKCKNYKWNEVKEV